MPAQTRVRYRSNTAVVLSRAADAAETIGKRFGSYVRKTARQSIKLPRAPRKATKANPTPQRDVSQPGEAPRDAGGRRGKKAKNGQAAVQKSEGPLKAFILFAWDASTRSVVIGPKRLPGKKDAPEALERGKTTTRRVFTGRGRDRRLTTRSVRYEARPFMVPALKKRLPELPGLWKNAIRA